MEWMSKLVVDWLLYMSNLGRPRFVNWQMINCSVRDHSWMKVKNGCREHHWHLQIFQVHCFNISYWRINNVLNKTCKVGCVLPMVIWPVFRTGQYRHDDRQIYLLWVFIFVVQWTLFIIMVVNNALHIFEASFTLKQK